MKINAYSLLTKLSGGLVAGAALIALFPASPSHAAQVRLYTNADLAALSAPENSVGQTATPAKGAKKGTAAAPVWKQPIPTQSAPLVHAEGENWDAIWAFIDREHAEEAQRRDQELAFQNSLTSPERLDQCFFGNCNDSIYRPGYLSYPGLMIRNYCMPGDFHDASAQTLWPIVR